ncbi:MAG: NAD-dependent deacylase [Aureibaculum sp.]|nr:NAD-dependent deacylase [Aureibaculum sp.]
MKKIVVLTGAGISAESGLKTFRDADGLWEGHDIMEVASPIGFERNPALVLDFYNQRRRQLLQVSPNSAHVGIAQLENNYEVTIVTQNVDDLHERAGSTRVIHLHGELLKMRSCLDENLVYDITSDINVGDLCEKKAQLRPHIVWFGESVPMLEKGIEISATADYLIIIGTSMQVYPAASLVHYIRPTVPIYFIDPSPSIQSNDFNNLTIIPEKATVGVSILVENYLNG